MYVKVFTIQKTFTKNCILINILSLRPLLVPRTMVSIFFVSHKKKYNLQSKEIYVIKL